MTSSREVPPSGSGLPSASTGPLPRREGQTLARRGSRFVAYFNFVKLPHTLFALPFALVGVVLASYRAPVTWPMICLASTS